MASNLYCSTFLIVFNTVKDCATVTDKYVVFILTAIVFHFLEDFILEPVKLKYKSIQHHSDEESLEKIYFRE